jgi:hypothetical protein
MIMITLDKIREASQCDDFLHMIEEAKLNFLSDEEFPLSTIVDICGVDDALWCLGSVIKNSKICARFAHSCAQSAAQYACCGAEEEVFLYAKYSSDEYRRAAHYDRSDYAADHAINAADYALRAVHYANDEVEWQKQTLKKMLDEAE